MWLLRFSSQTIGNFNTVEGAHQFLARKYGNENVTNLGEFVPMISIKSAHGLSRRNKTVPQSGRGRCFAFECKGEEFGYTRMTRYEVEEIPTLD